MTLNLSTLLDIAISLVFVFLTLSLFVSGIVEFINALIDKRSQLLQFALQQLLSGPIFLKFWNHHLTNVKTQKIAGFWKPISYLSADSFSTVLIDLLVNGQPAPPPPANTPNSQLTLMRIRNTMATNPAFSTLGPLIEPMLEKADTLADFKKALERWYDGYMEQVSGWFKRYAQGVVWVVAILVTLFFNIDTIKIAKRVASDKTLRANLVAQAEQTAHAGLKGGLFTPVSTSAQPDSVTVGFPDSNKAMSPIRTVNDPAFLSYLNGRNVTLANSLTTGSGLTGLDSLQIQDIYVQYLQENLESLGLPIGWTFPPQATLGQILSRIGGTIWSWSFFGWVLTAAALSFGAPFWFDLLLKLVNIRNVARRPIRSDGSN